MGEGDWWYIGGIGWWCVVGNGKEGEPVGEEEEGTAWGWDKWGLG